MSRLILSLVLAFVLFVLVVVILRAGLSYLFSWWAGREEASQRKRFDALIGLHERPVNYPPAKGAKGFENDVRHRRQA